VRLLPLREHEQVTTAVRAGQLPSLAVARRLALHLLVPVGVALLVAIRLTMGAHRVVSSSCPPPGTACTSITLGFPIADAWLVASACVGSLVGLLMLGMNHDLKAGKGRAANR
jgi:hypothetical protein